MSSKRVDEHLSVLMRGAEFGDEQTKAHMSEELRERLIESEKTKKPLRIYCGYDPTAPDIHLGHTVTMRKLRQFQELGHQAIFLVGTFTGLIGDPSDKDKARPRLTLEKLAENSQTYTQQAFRILDPEKTEVRFNADWLSQLTFADVIGLSANFTVQQFLARDNFSRRYKNGDPIWLHEFFYALMQGYDAIALEADVQLGATEQLFNLMAGRKLQESFGQKPQVCLTVPILVGTDGHLRMSKSTGNYVGIDEPAEVKYGKTMSIPDSAMRNWAELVTRWAPDQIDELLESVAQGHLHPMDAKKRLAWEIASIFDGDCAVDEAAAYFERVHQQRKLPQDIPTQELEGPTNIVDIIHAAGFVRSKSEARRLVQQGAVRLDDERVDDITAEIDASEEHVLQVGKRRFLRLV